MEQRQIHLTTLQNLGELLDAVKRLEELMAHPAGCFTAGGRTRFTDRMFTEAGNLATDQMPASLYERLVLDLAREVDRACGEGGEEAAMIACHLLREALPLLAAGADGGQLRRELDTLRREAVSALEAGVLPLEQGKASYRDALIASLTEDEELAGCVSRAFNDVGYGGYIQYDVANGFQSFYEVQEGSSFAKGFMSATMATDSLGMEAVLDNPLIVVSERPIVMTEDLLTFMKWAIEQQRPLLLIVEHVEDKPLQVMLLNKTQGRFTSVAVQAPKFGTERKLFMQDIALIVGGSVMSAEAGELGDAIDEEDFWQVGGAKKVVITKDRTTIHGGQGDSAKVEHRLAAIQKELETESDEKKREFLTDRITMLSGRVGRIYVSGLQEEANAKKRQAERMVAAVRDAAQTGVAVGDGFALAGAAARMKELDGALLGAAARRAMEAPARAALEQQGITATAVLDALHEMPAWAGYDFCNKTLTGNLSGAGRICSAGALYMAVNKAFSLASMLVSAEYAISTNI